MWDEQQQVQAYISRRQRREMKRNERTEEVVRASKNRDGWVENIESLKGKEREKRMNFISVLRRLPITEGRLVGWFPVSVNLYCVSVG